MIHPSAMGFHPNVRMIGHFRTRYFFSGAIFFDFHPSDHPMDHPRIILQSSEPDRDDAIILASSHGLASKARTSCCFFSCDHPSFILRFQGQTREIDPSSYYHPTFRHSRNHQKAIILLPSYCLREHPTPRGAFPRNLQI